jgi:hypothetical protein
VLDVRAPSVRDGPTGRPLGVRFQWLDGRDRMEELAYQRWDGERIAEEQFFYDPAQLAPPEPKP